VNTPPAKAGDFKLRMKAGAAGTRRRLSLQAMKTSSDFGGFGSWCVHLPNLHRSEINISRLHTGNVLRRLGQVVLTVPNQVTTTFIRILALVYGTGPIHRLKAGVGVSYPLYVTALN